MELVSTKPTKPTCSYVLNKRLFIFFCLFFFITGVYDGVQDDDTREQKRWEEDKNREERRERERQTEKGWKGRVRTKWQKRGRNKKN